jgi:hypothetical protein
MEVPVAVFLYKRPELARKVFKAIAQVEPKVLFLIADGPRSEQEEAACAAARSVKEEVNWPCEVVTNFSPTNLGCKRRMSSGISWVFDQVPEAIILEDDTVPHETFFRFCEELLQYYRNDERVMFISGDNFDFGHTATSFSYYFSRFTHVWGWASWRRAWKFYDVEMKQWNNLRSTGWLENLFSEKEVIAYWRSIFDRVYRGEIDTWDYQWLFTCWRQNGLSILPQVNLVTNIGFGSEGTHTFEPSNMLANLPYFEMQFPLRHPRDMIRNIEADERMLKTLFCRPKPRQPSLWTRAVRKSYRILSSLAD